MKENDWTKLICQLLQKENLGDTIHIDVLKKLPYAFEITSFDQNWNIGKENFKSTSFETDLVIYEEKTIPLFRVLLLNLKWGR